MGARVDRSIDSFFGSTSLRHGDGRLHAPVENREGEENDGEQDGRADEPLDVDSQGCHDVSGLLVQGALDW